LYEAIENENSEVRHNSHSAENRVSANRET